MSKPKQISFRADPDLGAQVDAAARLEEISVADFVRKIFRFGFQAYRDAGSLHALRLGVVTKAVADDDRGSAKGAKSLPKKDERKRREAS